MAIPLKGLKALEYALKFPMALSKGGVTGKGVMHFDNPTSVSIKMEPEVIESFTHQGLGVIIHISGSLYLIAFYLEASGVVSVYLVDGTNKSRKDMAGMVKKAASLRDLVSTLHRRIVSSHYWTGASWAPLKLPV